MIDAPAMHAECFAESGGTWRTALRAPDDPNNTGHFMLAVEPRAFRDIECIPLPESLVQHVRAVAARAGVAYVLEPAD